MSTNLGFSSTTTPATNFGIRNRISNVSSTATEAGSSVWSFFSSNLFYLLNSFLTACLIAAFFFAYLLNIFFLCLFVKCLGNLILDIIALGLKFGLFLYSEIGISLFNAFLIYPAPSCYLPSAKDSAGGCAFEPLVQPV